MPKTAEELAADAALESAAVADDSLETTPIADPAAAAIAAVKPTGNDEVDKLVSAALAAALPTALKAALDAQQAEAQRLAAEKAAREQGDYKTLFENSEKERHVLELNKWRGEALVEAGLDRKWFDAIQGDTKESMVAFAKQFKKNLDAEIKQLADQTREENPGTPRGAGRNVRTRTDKPTGEQKTNSTLRAAFGVSRLPRV